MITINDLNGHPVAKGPAEQTISDRCTRLTVVRVDVHAHPEGPALLVVTWADGSRGVCDWRDARDCVDWLRLQAWARNTTTLHFPRGPARQMVPGMVPA